MITGSRPRRPRSRRAVWDNRNLDHAGCAGCRSDASCSRGRKDDALGAYEAVWRRPELTTNVSFREHREHLVRQGTGEVFRYIYRHNLWDSPESVSGQGSEDAATARLRAEIPALFRRRGVRSIADVPCGDFGWLSRTELGVDNYFGGDIVPELVGPNPGPRRRRGVLHPGRGDHGGDHRHSHAGGHRAHRFAGLQRCCRTRPAAAIPSSTTMAPLTTLLITTGIVATAPLMTHCAMIVQTPRTGTSHATPCSRPKAEA